MGSLTVDSTHTVGIQIGNTNIDLSTWNWSANAASVPSSLWDTVNDGHETPGAKLIPGALTGLASGTPPDSANSLTGPPQIDIAAALQETLATDSLPLAPIPAGQPQLPQQNAESLTIIEQTVMAVAPYRIQLQQAAIAQNLTLTAGGRLDVMAASAAVTFQAPAQLGPLGSGNDIPSNGAPPAAANLQAPRKRPATVPVEGGLQLRCLIRQYTKSGKTYRACAASPAERAFIRSFVDTADPAMHAAKLLCGSVLLWDVAPFDQSNTWLESDGRIPLRVLAFDRHHAPLADWSFAAEPNRPDLPAGTAQVVVMGLDDSSAEPIVAGWDSSSMLVAVNPAALLVEGAILKPQSATRVRAGGDSFGEGLIDGATLLESNYVEAAGTPVRGRIDEFVPASTRAVVVRVRPATEGPRMPVANMRVFWRRLGQHRAMACDVAGSRTGAGTETAVFFSLPATQAGRESIQVLADPGPDWVLEGIYTSSLDASGLLEDWHEPEPHSRCVALPRNSSRSARIVLHHRG
jgi:hypothetical protein